MEMTWSWLSKAHDRRKFPRISEYSLGVRS
jgi:hypothetical protein